MSMIEELIEKESAYRKSLRADWRLAEAWAPSQLLQVGPENIESGVDPNHSADPRVHIEFTGCEKGHWTTATVYCSVCKKRKSDDVAKRCERLLQQLHDYNIRDDPSPAETFWELKSCFESVDRFECPHIHMRFYAQFDNATKENLMTIARRIVAYRSKMRKKLFEVKCVPADVEPILVENPPSNAIQQFEQRQAELQRLIEEGDAAIRAKYKSQQADVEIDINPADANAAPALNIKADVEAKLRMELQDWQKKRSDLILRAMS